MEEYFICIRFIVVKMSDNQKIFKCSVNAKWLATHDALMNNYLLPSTPISIKNSHKLLHAPICKM